MGSQLLFPTQSHTRRPPHSSNLIPTSIGRHFSHPSSSNLVSPAMSPSSNNSKAIALTFASTALLAAAQGTVTRSASAASSSFTPLAAKSFSYPDGIPYKADTDNGVRGPQYGYNTCNSTTEGQDSLCQTAFINDIEDFCLWAPPEPDSIVGNTEGEMVAWCTKPGRGTRLIPEGALQGVQFVRAPDYIQVVGMIDQTKLNIQ